MKLEEQVTSLELSKQLKAFGAWHRQESYFIWQQSTTGEWYIHEAICFDWGTEAFPAYTVAELGELLPRCYMSWATPQNGEAKWWCRRIEHHFVTHEETPTFTAATEADARAKMLIYLEGTNRLPIEENNLGSTTI